MRFSVSSLAMRLLPHRIATAIAPQLDLADKVLAGGSDRAVAGRTAVLAFGIRVASAALIYLSQIFFARILGQFDYGIYILVWVWLLILGNLAGLGFPTSVLRFIPEYIEKNRPDLLRGILLQSRLYGVIASTVLAIIGVAGAWLFQAHFDSYYLTPIYLAAICLPMMTLTETQDGIARAYDWVDLALLPPYLVRPLLILTFIAGATFAGFSPSAVVAVTSSIAATWITAIGQFFVMGRRLRRTVPAGPVETTPAYWIKASLPMFLIEGFFILLTNTDVVVAGWYLAPDDVAVYFAVVKTLALVHFVYFAVRAAAAHKFSAYHSAGDHARLSAFLHEMVKWTFWPSLAISLAMVLAGRWFLYLFGESYVVGYPLMFILVLGILARASIGPAESVLTMAGQQRLCAMIYGTTFLLNLALNVVLIPAFGLPGAASATLLAMTFESVMLFMAARDRLDLHVFIWRPRGQVTASAAKS
ncbi:MAG: lipopolysaccharide biosynthesis protein [Hyphomicrobiales bacterium]|nr:lipopolysaccharide biosynthesis protein [Hyphomicrobiales bacterium]